MKKLALVMPYYDNPGMLAFHYKTWCSYPQEMRDRLEVVIVDDGSPGIAAGEVERPEGLPNLKIYRVTVDLPWHQHAARNIGAFRAKSPWLLLTDMDHLVPEATLQTLLDLEADPDVVYTFPRVDPKLQPKIHPVSGCPHPHPNTFLMTKELFWKIGGYDEDFCGIYGTDAYFRKRMEAACRKIHLQVPLILYSRDDMPDASTRSLPRKEGRPPGVKKMVMARKRREGTLGKPKVLSMPYVRVFPF